MFTNANNQLPYTGAGTGIVRAMEEKPDVTFESHETAHEFVIIFRRKSDQVSDQVANQVANQVTNQEMNQVTHQVTHQESVREGVQVSVQEDVQGKRSKD